MITVKIEGLNKLKAEINGMQKQVRFAASKALNAVGKKVSEAMPAEIERALDRPTPFTKRAVRVLDYAKKTKLLVTVGVAPIQEKYLKYAIDGGTRNPGPAGLKLPSAIKLNEFGNVPKGLIKQLIAVANKERKLSKVKARRVAVSNKVDLFYGDPVDQKGKTYPRGIYKRANGHLIPLIVFPVAPAKYKPRLPFRQKAESVVRVEWSKQFDIAMAEALRTAR